MEIYRTETRISKDHSLDLKNLPFAEGERVEVIVRRQQAKSKSQARYPLRGKPFRYSDPFKGAAEDDWESLK
ncbi:MAG: hypothetical protein L0Z70_00555 [Chloroflexi bacterium]|nr:hypothetical protein [Chloroflexota bacterium]